MLATVLVRHCWSGWGRELVEEGVQLGDPWVWELEQDWGMAMWRVVWEEVWGCGEGQKQDSLQGEKCCHYDGTSLVRDGWAGLGVPFG